MISAKGLTKYNDIIYRSVYYIIENNTIHNINTLHARHNGLARKIHKKLSSLKMLEVFLSFYFFFFFTFSHIGV